MMVQEASHSALETMAAVHNPMEQVEESRPQEAVNTKAGDEAEQTKR